MDQVEYLAVHFHWGGDLASSGSNVNYIGGSDDLAYIERNKMSLPELKGHFKDVSGLDVDDKRFHWLLPGKDMRDGFMLLYDDTNFELMKNTILDWSYAEVFVEKIGIVEAPAAECSGVAMAISNQVAPGMPTPLTEIRSSEIGNDNDFYESSKSTSNKNRRIVTRKTKQIVQEVEEEQEESSDSEYVPSDSSCSEEDDEVVVITEKFREYKKMLQAGKYDHLDEIYFEGLSVGWKNMVGGENEDGSSYEDSTDFNDSFDETDGEGHLVKRESRYPRFSENHDVPQFSLGMKFTDKQQFKEAIIKYGLHEKKLIRFKKDDLQRVRAVCDWVTCSWTCLLSNTTKSESWQITTFNDLHTCPQRKDNKLVTAKRIAMKYEKLIRANPSWRIESLKSHISEEMFADVSIHKVKRAKKLVMLKWLDATKGQYGKIYEYQAELLRSNPGSTVVVKLEPNIKVPTFQRIYVCLDAIKKGFMPTGGKPTRQRSGRNSFGDVQRHQMFSCSIWLGLSLHKKQEKEPMLFLKQLLNTGPELTSD